MDDVAVACLDVVLDDVAVFYALQLALSLLFASYLKGVFPIDEEVGDGGCGDGTERSGLVEEERLANRAYLQRYVFL